MSAGYKTVINFPVEAVLRDLCEKRKNRYIIIVMKNYPRSWGHAMNFAEAFLDRKLNGRVLTSALKSDMVCTYEVSLPDDILEKYVKECPGD